MSASQRTLLLDSDGEADALEIECGSTGSETLTSSATRVMYVLTKISGGAEWQSKTGI